MIRCGKWKIVFIGEIFLVVCKAIASEEGIFDGMSLEERKSFFETEDGSVPDFELVKLPRTPRSRRDLTATLDITFSAFGVVTTSALFLVDDHDLISRTSTGVFFAESHRTAHHGVAYIPRPDVLEHVGEFDLFQNIHDCSAIARFWNTAGDEMMTGILKQDYSVKTMPQGPEDGFVNIVHKHFSRTSRSANSTEDRDDDSPVILVIFKNPKVSEKYFSRRGSSRLDLKLHRTKRQNAVPSNVPSVVYPKLLVSPDFRLMRDSNIDTFIAQLIAHMNAVDMVFRQLHDPAVRIKIAGIIIPLDEFATPYIAQNTITAPSLITDNVMTATRAYFLDEERRFQFNFYNAVVMMTTNSLFSLEVSGNLKPILGLAMIGSGCFVGRAITTYAKGFAGVLNMAHELGHVFGAFDEPLTPCPDNDGFTMVSNAGAGRLLKWSACSQHALSSYLRSQAASCMHYRPYELPDALKNYQGAWLSILGQCDNVFNDPADSFCSHPDGSLRGCQKNGVCIFVTNFPMEGTETLIGQRWINNQSVLMP